MTKTPAKADTDVKSSRRGSSESPAQPSARPTRSALLAGVLAWLVPGGGHLYLGRWQRGLIFFGLVGFSLVLGCLLDGRLFVAVAGQPLSNLGTLASMAMGIPYFVLRYGVEYQGDLLSSSYEYGGAFLLTAGLMNVLVVLDAWDIGEGRKA